MQCALCVCRSFLCFFRKIRRIVIQELVTFLVWFTPLDWWKIGIWGKKMLIEIYLCGCLIKSSSFSSRMKVTPKPQTDWFRFGHLYSFFLFCFSQPLLQWNLHYFKYFWAFSLWSHEGYCIAQSNGEELSVVHTQPGLSKPFWFADTTCLLTWYYKKKWFLANPFQTSDSWRKNTHFYSCDMRKTVFSPLFLVLDTVTLGFLSSRWDWLGTSHTESQMQGCQLHVKGN